MATVKQRRAAEFNAINFFFYGKFPNCSNGSKEHSIEVWHDMASYRRIIACRVCHSRLSIDEMMFELKQFDPKYIHIEADYIVECDTIDGLLPLIPDNRGIPF